MLLLQNFFVNGKKSVEEIATSRKTFEDGTDGMKVTITRKRETERERRGRLGNPEERKSASRNRHHDS